MYVLLLAVLQWLHVFFGIFWFGSVLTMDFIVVPAIQSVPPAVRQAFGGALAKRAPMVITQVAGTTILLGLVRGIASGVLGVLGSPYGLTWIASFVLGVGLMVFGLRVMTPAADKVRLAGQGPDFEAALARIKRLSISELGGFIVILVFMIAMRFGY